MYEEVFLIIISIGVIYTSVNSEEKGNAEKQHKHDSEGMEQAVDHFILDKFSDESNQTVRDFYKKDVIRVQYNWWDENYNVVELDQSEKGNELTYPYVIKITVIHMTATKQINSVQLQLRLESHLFSITKNLMKKI